MGAMSDAHSPPASGAQATDRRGRVHEAPHLAGVPFLGHLSALRRDPIAVFQRAAATGHDLVRLPVGAGSVYVLRRTEDVKRVLLDNRQNFSKQTRGYAALRFVLGNGLITSEGEFWLRQRRLAQPAFHRQRLAQFGERMVELTQQLLEQWERAARLGSPVDVASDMMALTLRIVGWTLLSSEVGPHAPSVSEALNELLHQVIRRTTQWVRLPRWLRTPQNRALQRARRNLDRVVLGMIAERRESGAERPDLLGMLMFARDEETGETMSDQQLRDEVMTIFLAGHETTANALTWTLYLLFRHPEVRDRLEREVASALHGRPPRVEDLPKLGYVLAVVQEAMRLYPPVWMLMRRSEREDVLAGFRVPAGAYVAVCPFLLHRDPRLFENPERFDPERFMGERAARIPRFGYIPFSAGPRMCIGNGFALMEAQLVLASIAQRFRLELAPGHPVELDPAVTLRPKHGMRMTLRPAEPRVRM
jgi:cytochrome P450